jgi:hypothetical protein
MKVQISQEELIKMVFADPLTITSSDEKIGYCSLRLLRRDIMHCLCITPTGNTELAIWPAAMAICAGIDLLGYYVKTNGFQERAFDADPEAFIDYCKKYDIVKTHEDAVTLYSFRCSLMHKYSLYNIYDEKTYVFTVAYRKKRTALISHNQGTNEYWINLYILYKKFEESINHCHQAVITSSGLKNSVSSKIAYLGIIGWDNSNIGSSGSYVKSVIVK